MGSTKSSSICIYGSEALTRTDENVEKRLSTRIRQSKVYGCCYLDDNEITEATCQQVSQHFTIKQALHLEWVSTEACNHDNACAGMD